MWARTTGSIFCLCTRTGELPDGLVGEAHAQGEAWTAAERAGRYV